VLRKAVFLAAAAAVVFPTAAAAVELAPGMEYKRELRSIGGEQVVVHVLTAPKPGGLYGLKPVLSNGTVMGRETVSGMQRRLSRSATLAGINGDMFNWTTGRPSGLFLRNGVLSTRAMPARSTLGIGLDGILHTGLVRYQGTWQFGSNALRPLTEFNHPVEKTNGVALFSPTWGPAAPHLSHARELVLSHVAKVGPNKDLSGRVVARPLGTGHAIPSGGAILQARGDRRTPLLDEGKVGNWVKLHIGLTPWWTGVKDAIGGGPRLVSGGVPVFQADEAFLSSQLLPRNPRTAVGQLGNNGIILVAVDGRKSWSAGVTNTQLARLMVNLGAETAMALDAGGSTTMAFGGRVLNHPSDGSERPVADALMVTYYGIYARPARLSLYSPNGDGTADLQRLYAKVVRTSRVTMKLVRAADGFIRWKRTGVRHPGTFVKEVRRGLRDGRWRWEVSAVDSQGRSSQMARAFVTNTTLGHLALSKRLMRPTRRGGRLDISFRVARQADVAVTVRTLGGAVVRHLASSHLGAGRYAVRWNAKNDRGRVVHTRRYLVRVRASNGVGVVALTGGVHVVRRF
jgi:Phosphodiester glycosidase